MVRAFELKTLLHIQQAMTSGCQLPIQRPSKEECINAITDNFADMVDVNNNRQYIMAEVRVSDYETHDIDENGDTDLYAMMQTETNKHSFLRKKLSFS